MNLVPIDVERLSEARLRRGMLRKELAAAAGISTRTLYRALREGRVGVVSARRMAKVLGLRLPELTGAAAPKAD